MPIFSYEAMDARGRAIKGEIEATTPDDAGSKLRQQGLFPTNVKLKTSGPATAGAIQTKSTKRPGALFLGSVSYKDLTVFTRQLATLLDAGLPVVRSLEILEGQMKKPPRFKYALQDIVEDVKAGATLSEAMGKFPEIFNVLYVNMIKAGEAGGVLVPILERLAIFMEKTLKLRKRVFSALIYPVAVICIAAAVLTGIMIFVIPNFEKVFKDVSGAGGNLPWLTQMVLNTSRWMGRNWFVLPLIPLAIWGLFKLIRANEGSATAYDKFVLILPVFGGIVEKSNVARFSRTLGTLIASGVPILEALDIIKAATANRVYSKVVGQIHENIRQGGAVAEPLANSRAFDDMVVNMVRVGEETGELDKMLLKIAENYDDEVDNLVAGLISLLEPFIIVVMGLTVGTIVIALFLPLIDLMNKLSQKKG